MVGLSLTVSIDGLEVHHTPGATITLGCDEHPGAPLHGGVDRDTFKDTKADIPLQPYLDLCSPVCRHRSRSVNCDRSGILIHKAVESKGGGTAIHEGEWLHLAPVEGT